MTVSKYDSTEDTRKHITTVKIYINRLVNALTKTAIYHDTSKLYQPEKAIFDEYTPKLATSTYGSEEYKGFLKGMGIALEHHYANNRHHPEHFENGIKGMNLIDLCEMISDWKGATLRHNDGDILKSIEMNQQRFGYTDELKQILINTVVTYFEDKE